MRKSWRNSLAVLAAIAIAVTTLATGLAAPAAAGGNEPGLMDDVVGLLPGDSGPITEPIVDVSTPSSPEDWRTDTEYDPLYTKKVSAAEADKFARFWTSMFLGDVDDPQFRMELDQVGLVLDASDILQGYVDSSVDNVNDLLFPGRASFTEAEQRYLIYWLIETWFRNVPGFAQVMTAPGVPRTGDDEVDETIDDTVPDTMTTAQLAHSARAIIFEKAQAKTALTKMFASDDGSDTEVAAAPELGQQTLVDQATSALDAAAVGLPALDAAGLGIVPPDVLALLDKLQAYVPPINSDAVAGQVNYAVGQAGAAITNPPSVDDVQALVSTALYTACANLPTGAKDCRTVPLGSPALLSVDGIAATKEVTVTLAPDVTGSVGGVGARLTAVALPGFEKAIATATMYVDQAQGFITAGFKGLPALLGQSATVGLDNPFAAIQGDIQLRATVTHTNLPTKVTNLTLIGGYQEVTETKAPVETTSAEIEFLNAPTTLVARLRLVDKRVEATLDSLNTRPKVKATISQVSHVAPKDTLTGTLVIDALPEHAQVVIDLLDDLTTINYTATSTIKTLAANLVTTSSTGKTTLAASVTDVPAAVTVKLDSLGRITYEAGSRVTSANASRTFTYPNGKINQVAATVTGVPMKWSFEALGEPMVIKYEATEEITKVTGSYVDQLDNRQATVTVDKIPAGLTTVTIADNGISYSAAAPIPKIVATAKALGFNVGLTLVGIPTAWSATFDDSGLVYEANDADGLDSISATLTNHVTINRPAGNHATFNIAERAVAGGKVARDIDASLFMTKVKRVVVRTGEPAALSIQAGGGGAFRAVGSLKRTDGVRASVDAQLSALPAAIDMAFGRTTTITTDRNFNLKASMRYSDTDAALANLGVVPQIHGVTLRDGADPADPTKKAYGAELYLTGLPRTVTIGSGSFKMVGFKPALSTLGVDILLDNEAQPIAAYAGLNGLPVNLPIDLDLSSSSRPIADGGTEIKTILDSHGRSLGALNVRVRRGATGGSLFVSNIPSRIETTITEIEGQTVVDWAAASRINTVSAEFHHATPTNTMRVAGSIVITSVPANFTITAGRDAGGAGPLLNYTADSAGMSIRVKADGSLQSASSSLKANLDFVLSGLPTQVNVDAAADRVELSSPTGKLGLMQATVSAAYEYNKQGRDTINDGGWISFPYEYRIGVGAEVRDFVVTLAGASSFVLEPGILSKLSGSFDSFSFNWKNLNVHANAYGSIKARIDWPSPFGSTTIMLAQAAVDLALGGIQFHTYENRLRPWVSAHQSLLFCSLDVDVLSKPGRRQIASGTSLVQFANPSTAGGHYYIVPNPGATGLIPDALVDIVAIAMAEDRDFDIDFDLC